MVYFRDRIRQSDESDESDDQQHEPDYKKFSSEKMTNIQKNQKWQTSVNFFKKKN